MKKHFTKLTLSLLLSLTAHQFFGQALIQDRWDTLYANVDYANTTTFLNQRDVLKFGNNLAILSDSGNSNPQASYLQIFNASTNTLATINFQRLAVDQGMCGGAVFSATNGVNYLFWGPLNNSNTTTHWGLYNYNSQTNSVISESVNLSLDFHKGVMNLGFYSPSTNNDSLSIFVGKRVLSDDSIYVYRKKYNQSGFVNSGIPLPIKLDFITKVFNFNNEIYVAGYSYPYDGKLLRSNDGINFTVVASYESDYPAKYIVDAEVMNNKLYFGTFNGNAGYLIVETPDGSTFNTIVSNTDYRALSSIECFNNTVWYSHYQFYGNKPSNSNSSTNNYSFNAPSVGYLNMSNFNEIQSTDTLGREYNDGFTFKLKKFNSRLFLSGNYDFSYSVPGNFIYEFIPPVANFTIASNNICANTIYNFVNQSVNADSVRWYLDNNNISTSNVITWSLSPGTHTLGLIAISGSQKDSIEYVLNSYTVGINLNPSILGCINNKISIVPALVGAMNPVNYTWTCSSALTQTSLTNPSLVVTATAAATYTYDLIISDVNGCSGATGIDLLTVNPNKDINGTVDVASAPLTSGNVVLYRYEPILTKFDSVTYQPLNASGTYTFGITDAHTYILKCEPSASTLMITYAPSEVSWKTATLVTHGCLNNTTRNISVVPILNIGTGPGTLSGKITEGQNYAGKGTVAPGNPIGGLTIKGGKNPGGNIVAQGRTNSAGEYTISNLPTSLAGESYFILVDVAGLDTNTTYHCAITTLSLQYGNLDFVVDSAKINPTNITSGIKEIAIGKDLIKIYPNPTNGLLNIQFKLNSAQAVEIKLCDLTGKEVKTILPLVNYYNTELKMQTQLSDMKAGVYIIKAKIGDAERTTRVVVTN